VGGGGGALCAPVTTNLKKLEIGQGGVGQLIWFSENSRGLADSFEECNQEKPKGNHFRSSSTEMGTVANLTPRPKREVC